MPNKTLLDILQKIETVHHIKAEDYTTHTEVDPYENFSRAAVVGEWFPPSTHKSFATLVAVKLARLGALLTKGGPPKNESISDTFLDLCTYCILWYSYYQDTTKDLSTAVWPRAEPIPAPAPVIPPIDALDEFKAPTDCQHEEAELWRDRLRGKCVFCKELIAETTMAQKYYFSVANKRYLKK